jgi:hypothetical protein
MANRKAYHRDSGHLRGLARRLSCLGSREEAPVSEQVVLLFAVLQGAAVVLPLGNSPIERRHGFQK